MKHGDEWFVVSIPKKVYGELVWNEDCLFSSVDWSTRAYVCMCVDFRIGRQLHRFGVTVVWLQILGNVVWAGKWCFRNWIQNQILLQSCRNQAISTTAFCTQTKIDVLPFQKFDLHRVEARWYFHTYSCMHLSRLTRGSVSALKSGLPVTIPACVDLHVRTGEKNALYSCILYDGGLSRNYQCIWNCTTVHYVRSVGVMLSLSMWVGYLPPSLNDRGNCRCDRASKAHIPAPRQSAIECNLWGRYPTTEPRD